jgi:hypothetical protein
MNTPSAGQTGTEKTIPEGAQGKVLAQFLGMQYVDRLPEPSPPRNPVRGDFDRIAGSWGRQFLTVPVGGDDAHVVVATADPLNVEAIDQLRGLMAEAIDKYLDEIQKIEKSHLHRTAVSV